VFTVDSSGGWAMTEPKSVTIHAEPVLVDSRTLAQLLGGISARHLAGLESTGRIGPLPVQGFGRRRLYDYGEIKRWAIGRYPSRREWEGLKGKQ
jgi:hypothetical protein